jgi:diguanylate cyclase (GGDEF)-like protein
MARAITGRITQNLVAGIVITVATVLVTVSWMAHKHDEQAALGTETMVVGGVQAMSKRLAQLANDYGWWEEAYDAYERGDREWIDVNIGTGITETYIADLLVIVSPDGTVDYGWIVEDTDSVEEIVTPAALDEIRALADALPVGNKAGRSGFVVDTPSDPMMLSIQHVTPVSRAEEVASPDLPIIAFGLYLDEQRLHDLGTGFLIDDLRFERADSPPDGAQVVTDIHGKTLGYFAWTPPQPGNALLRSVLVPIGIALTLFCVVALVTAMRARRMAIALTDSEQEAVTAARTDSMTGLMNRAGFSELIESEAYDAPCRDGELAIVYLDVNGFKTVNDSIGHHGGDDLVRALAGRIASAIPPGAALARIGGDEFAVALRGEGVAARVASAASAVAHSIDRPFAIGGFEFHVTASVGYATSGEPGVDAAELIRRADLAMYRAKNAAEREPVAYHASMETGALEKKKLEAGLRRALENGEFKVFYQPLVRAADMTVVGLEALMRWTSAELGPVSPALFIPVAEETGLIHDIGRLVLNQACQDLGRWPDLKMAINISPVQLRNPNFADDVMAIVDRYGVSPHQFELELTEGILVDNPTMAKRKLTVLKDLGFILSLDDFGTGFSSIGYLRQFPFDILKVDRSFIRDIGLNSTANALIQSLVSLGDAMDLSVIAEGIETEDQLKLLRLVQCEYAQGFLICRPVPATEIDELLGALGDERRIRLRSESMTDAVTGPARARA